FPLRGLVSANFDSLPWYQKITDYLWHITLPVLATVIAGFPATFISMFFTGSLLIEVMFSLNGLGLLGYEAT
ncbi:microcin ABC transporter permease, partial [Escherichia coli]|nr:microcin ABC transporter permease [Escherichia coli]